MPEYSYATNHRPIASSVLETPAKPRCVFLTVSQRSQAKIILLTKTMLYMRKQYKNTALNGATALGFVKSVQYRAKHIPR